MNYHGVQHLRGHIFCLEKCGQPRIWWSQAMLQLQLRGAFRRQEGNTCNGTYPRDQRPPGVLLCSFLTDFQICDFHSPSLPTNGRFGELPAKFDVLGKELRLQAGTKMTSVIGNSKNEHASRAASKPKSPALSHFLFFFFLFANYRKQECHPSLPLLLARVGSVFATPFLCSSFPAVPLPCPLRGSIVVWLYEHLARRRTQPTGSSCGVRPPWSSPPSVWLWNW